MRIRRLAGATPPTSLVIGRIKTEIANRRIDTSGVTAAISSTTHGWLAVKVTDNQGKALTYFKIKET